ncbi:hypothetical protein GALMADRAFT_145100 [Galerina marginata CBS 339.88]|uniref:Uncharacterized protein n=1 Tax=Galerina marginata (strain CBS 339.88) TaxID=685588 RepID=A0A067STI8_GALM3|nr:hypothetical protein GALMADRAFT_145100 [Galerina marginata CBS 339.88]
MDFARPELTYLENAGKDRIETSLGLSESGRITLEIIRLSQRAKRHRKDCTYIADQAYQLVNAVDGGVKGRVIDVNNILQDHITHLNKDLEQIRKTVKKFASWWILFRSRDTPQRLEKCHDILYHSMNMYLQLLRFSLNQPAAKSPRHRRHVTSNYQPVEPRRQTRRNTHPLPPATKAYPPASMWQSSDHE